MHYSPHQLAYFAHKLTLRGATDSMDRTASALLDAQVDLNPHQIDAALFATSNPLSKGAILADEVGLGATMLEAKSFRQARKDGTENPFDAASAAAAQRHSPDKIVIYYYQFAAGKADAIKSVAWDLRVVDEAHRLRNVYKPENNIARTFRAAQQHQQVMEVTVRRCR